MTALLQNVADYYDAKLRQHGSTPQGVDWNGESGQQLRFAQLSRLLPSEGAFSLLDVGCGYGAYYQYLQPLYPELTYEGLDIAPAMIEAAEAAFGQHALLRWTAGLRPQTHADFAVASGIFNVRLKHEEEAWWDYILTTLDQMHADSVQGFAFNCLTAYSDRDKMQDTLYYADPCRLFDHCKRHYSRQVALLHDYGLYEFTILVRKNL